jgi:hypothetical protein
MVTVYISEGGADETINAQRVPNSYENSVSN